MRSITPFIERVPCSHAGQPSPYIAAPRPAKAVPVRLARSYCVMGFEKPDRPKTLRCFEPDMFSDGCQIWTHITHASVA